MANDPRRLESGKFFFEIAKFLLTAVAIGNLLAERSNVVASAVGAVLGVLVSVVAFFVLPSKEEG